MTLSAARMMNVSSVGVPDLQTVGARCYLLMDLTRMTQPTANLLQKTLLTRSEEKYNLRQTLPVEARGVTVTELPYRYLRRSKSEKSLLRTTNYVSKLLRIHY